MGIQQTAPENHPFSRSPHSTLLTLSIPVLFSLIAEPLTGLVDTAFIARLGAVPLAALGVGTMVLSSLFWVFNFLGIGTQTEVAQATGRQDHAYATQINGLAVALSGLAGIIILIVGMPFTETIASILGATGAIHDYAVEYIHIRWFGAPAVLMTMTAFGTLRGLQDMRIPLWIALSVNGLNVILDAVLIFGIGPFPALGITGAALASVISQWIGAVWTVIAVYHRLGIPDRLPIRKIRVLLKIGGDLFIRTGMLNLFLLLTTRAATRIGADSGAAHQAIRQVWMFATLVLDAYAITGQSLVAYFIGPGRFIEAKRVAFVVCAWGFCTGILLSVSMWLGQDIVAGILVPTTAVHLFSSAWIIVALVQPVNALAFATDGIHWGTGDFRYLRNVVTIATLTGVLGVYLIDEQHPDALTHVWLVSTVWISIRAFFGVTRIWPGIGTSPLAPKAA